MAFETCFSKIPHGPKKKKRDREKGRKVRQVEAVMGSPLPLQEQQLCSALTGPLWKISTRKHSKSNNHFQQKTLQV
jgi:hypothetical protein